MLATAPRSGRVSAGPLGEHVAYGEVTGLSDEGTAVGFYSRDGTNRGFLWTADRGMIDLSNEYGVSIRWANAVSSDGASILVAVHRDSGGDYNGVLHADREIVTLPAPDGCGGATPLAISADKSSAAGLVFDTDDDCRWPVACRWPTLDSYELCGRLNGAAWARAISPDGATVAGQGWNDDGGRIAFSWTKNAGMIKLDPPAGSYESDALGVSDGGTRIVGRGLGATLWERDYDATTLKDVLQNDFKLDMRDWDFYGDAVGVSADGTVIVGQSGRYRGEVVGWIAHVPMRRERGDMNCDGAIDFDDIDGFVVAITSRKQYEQQYPDCYFTLADVNRDGEVDFDDIDPFVERLIR